MIVSMNGWVVKQLRAKIIEDLREFVEDGYFDGELEKFKLNVGIENSGHYSHELRWGYLASKLGTGLFFHSDAIMTARQVAAAEVLMNLGMLAGAEAFYGIAMPLSQRAKAAGVSDENAGVAAEQCRNEVIPSLSDNVVGALEQYLRYLAPSEANPFVSLLTLQALPPLEETIDTRYEYDFVLSFAGEDRNSGPEELKKLLEKEHVNVFYDKDNDAELWGQDLYQKFAKIYGEKSLFFIPFISKNYIEKVWCKHELSQAQARAFKSTTEYILPLRLDDTEVPGINKTTGYIDLRILSIAQVAQLCLQKLSAKKESITKSLAL